MNPHRVLADRYSHADEKPAFVRSLFDRGAAHYDAIVHWGFLGTGGYYRRWTQKRHGMRPGMKVLDVACGTGQVASAAARILGSAEGITCLDASEGMLAVARSRLSARFVLGRAEALPFPDNSFDMLTMGYALRHVTDLEQVFGEFLRVLKPGGRLLILEITKPSSRVGASLFKLYFGRLYPALTRLFTRSNDARTMMDYFWQTMDACVPTTSIRAAMRGAGCEEVKSETRVGLFSEFHARKPLPAR